MGGHLVTAELFPDPSPAAAPVVEATAWVSDDGRHRFYLSRKWGPGPSAVFVMLNPSTADGTEDDPTVRRCLGFARRLGCTSLEVVNLFAWRATDPADVVKAQAAGEDITGGEPADVMLRLAATEAHERGGAVIAAWGAGPAGLRSAMAQRIPAVLELIGRPWCLGTTRSGQPRHPLYLPATAPLTLWTAP